MAYTKADKSMFGIPGILYRDLLELDLGQHDVRTRRKILWSIHCWICAINPNEDKKPENCKETLPELRDMNESELNGLAHVEEWTEGVPVTQEDVSAAVNLLGGIEARIKQIVFRGKLIDDVRPTTGAEAP
jgi:hypothetical protein